MFLWLAVVAVLGAGVAVANRRYLNAVLIVVLGLLAGVSGNLLAREGESLVWVVPPLLYTGFAGWLAARSSYDRFGWGRVALGGLIGMVPGLLVMLVPVALHEMDVITSDQSQIGFLGMPIALLGVFVGAIVGGYYGRGQRSDAATSPQGAAQPTEQATESAEADTLAQP